jgi:hypothetical protein
MDRSNNFLLEQLKQACWQRTDSRLERTDGRWQLLATAAGHEESIRQTLESLDVNELRLDSIKALPASLVGDRIMALSVSRPQLIGDLLSEWEKEPRTGDPCIDAACLNAAINTGRRFLTVVKLDPDAEPWSWEEQLKNEPLKIMWDSQYIQFLASRPLVDKTLTLENMENCIEHGKALLETLRTQEVQIDEAVFHRYADLISSTDPYVIAMLIELSRRTNFDSRIWFERMLEVFPTISYPLYLTLSTYTLLNDQWVIPW